MKQLPVGINKDGKLVFFARKYSLHWFINKLFRRNGTALVTRKGITIHQGYDPAIHSGMVCVTLENTKGLSEGMVRLGGIKPPPTKPRPPAPKGLHNVKR